MSAAAPATAGHDRGNAATTATFTRSGGLIWELGSTWESRPALSAPSSPAVDRKTRQRQRSGSQPLRSADRLVLDSGQPARAPAGFPRALRAYQADAGLADADVGGRAFARALSAITTLSERKARAWNTARASAHAPAHTRAKGAPASIWQATHTDEPASKMDDRHGPGGQTLTIPANPSPKIPAFEFPRSPLGFFSSQSVVGFCP